MKPMAEKDNDSMATVQIKPEYAPSEVYSTASEPPPAYKRQSNSVKIAKITAFTIIVSSFIIGSFILASAYLQARASCDQVQALDSVLEKELMLETLQQVNKELPRADALIGIDTNDEADLQNLDKDEPIVVKKMEQPKETAPVAPAVNNEQANESETDSSFSESEETDDLQKIPTKVPLELDLSDLAAALLQNNKKSRMNCVVERKHAEEIVDSPSKTVNLPFGVNLTTDPKKARITGERISIFCESGNEDKEQEARNQVRDEVSDVEAIRPMFIPFQRVPIPFGQTPNEFPLTHMPQRMMPPMPQQQQQPPMIRQMPPPFQHMPMAMRPPMPPQIMQAPHPEPMQEQHVRIQVHRLPFREIHVADDIPVQIPSGNQEMPHIQVQRVPLGLALQRAGITADDLRNIQRAAEERITDELRRLAAEEAAESSSDSDSNSNEEDDSQSQSNEQMQAQELQQQRQQQQQQQQQQEQRLREEEQLTTQQLPMEPRDTMTPPMPDQPQILQIGRTAYGRSLISPVHIPIPMNQAQADMNQEAMESERPHYVQPRSIRSTDNLFQPEKRVKKCACDCSC